MPAPHTHMPEQPDEIYFERPGNHLAALPYRIVAAGRTWAQTGAPRTRQRFNQHVLILPLSGHGQIRLGARVYRASPGALAWLDTTRQYEHGCAQNSAAWQYLWLGILGHGLDALFAGFNMAADPLVTLPNAEVWAKDFGDAIARLREPSPAGLAMNSAAVAKLVAFLVLARGNTAVEGDAQDATMAALVAQMRDRLGQAWSIGGLARCANLSAAQLHRRFRQAYGTTPIDWLRRERIHAAKGLLVGSTAKIATIAAECGYSDPYHFSRDFARMTGQAPSAFRRAGGR